MKEMEVRSEEERWIMRIRKDKLWQNRWWEDGKIILETEKIQLCPEVRKK